jgi:hypothetical protein
MKAFVLSAAFMCSSIGQVYAWAQEGHSVVVEIAQRRLSPQAANAVEELLGKGHSLASIASWADGVPDQRPNTYDWHFVNIPIGEADYRPARDCVNDPAKGDCIVAELDRLKNDLRCASGEAKVEALKFTVHFVGDIHQPLHTVREKRGGNDIEVDIFMHGLTCLGTCKPPRTPTNFHAAWDQGLITKAVWDWGAYVDRLENSWLKSAEANLAGIDGGMPADWAVESHKSAQVVWKLLPDNRVLDDKYFRKALPILDRQLGVAGLRLARFLNEAYSSQHCPVVGR